MMQEIAGLTVDIAPPEKPKFKSPLLLIHGLWTGSWSWRAWATHFSNLGWECWSINFRGRANPRELATLAGLTFADCLADLRRIIRAAPHPPILLAHDFGGLVAQKACEEEKPAALVLLSSLPPVEEKNSRQRELRLLRLKYFALLFLRRPFLLKERDFRDYWLASLGGSEQAEIANSFVLESGRLASEFFDRRIAVEGARISSPILIVGGADDRIVPAKSLRDTARQLEADLKEYPGHGHWLMGESEGEEITRDIHRWLVQKLGEEILLAEFSRRE